MSNEKILQYLLKLENLTLDTIEQVLPKIEPRNNMEGYETAAIKQFKKVGSLLACIIYRAYRDYHHTILEPTRCSEIVERDVYNFKYSLNGITVLQFSSSLQAYVSRVELTSIF